MNTDQQFSPLAVYDGRIEKPMPEIETLREMLDIPFNVKFSDIAAVE